MQQRILTEIKGRMLEDIVLLETELANPKKQVFVLQFPVGEFDMVVFDPEAGSCRIFEIKHSEEAAPQQYRHLIDACYLEHYCFRHRLHSCSLAARFLRIATCHTSSLFCVTACHMTSCIIKPAAPNEKSGRRFYHARFLRYSSTF